jgi:hypothetical protein
MHMVVSDNTASLYERIVGPSFAQAWPNPAQINDFKHHLRSDHSRQLFAYWLMKCSGDIPRRADLSPHEMKGLLPRLSIWEHVPQADAVHVRLAGTYVVETLAQDPSGHLNSDILPPEWVEAMRLHGADFYQGKAPLYFLSSLAPYGRGHVHIEFLSLPLRREGTKATMGIGIMDRVEIYKAAS